MYNKSFYRHNQKYSTYKDILNYKKTKPTVQGKCDVQLHIYLPILHPLFNLIST